MVSCCYPDVKIKMTVLSKLPTGQTGQPIRCSHYGSALHTASPRPTWDTRQILFMGFSLAFNTIIPDMFHQKLTHLHLPVDHQLPDAQTSTGLSPYQQQVFAGELRLPLSCSMALAGKCRFVIYVIKTKVGVQSEFFFSLTLFKYF